MNRKSNYRNMDRFRITRNNQKNRYYGKSTIYPRSTWTFEQDKMVLEHSKSDSEISMIIQHSVKAIQNRRHRLKLQQQLEDQNDRNFRV